MIEKLSDEELRAMDYNLLMELYRELTHGRYPLYPEKIDYIERVVRIMKEKE